MAVAGCLSAPAATAAPTVEHMVVFRDGTAKGKRVSSGGVRVRVGRKRCAVAGGTALAALVRSRPGRIRLKDFGSCSLRPRDSASLFVSAIGRDRNRGLSGWVYKVGNRAARAAASDPDGPFGRGRLRSGQRVLWFYCRRAGSCQRTLAARARPQHGGVVDVRVRGYDDDGRRVAVEGASVSLGGFRGLTDASGFVRLQVPPGDYLLRAVKRGMIRSFGERVAVR